MAKTSHSDVSVRPVSLHEVDRIREVDVTESDTLLYRVVDGRIEETHEEWRRPPWDDRTATRHVRNAEMVLREGGVLLGAFHGDRLVGFALLRLRLGPAVAQLANLQVSRAHRRRAIATRLVSRLFGLARQGGASQIYVSACPSRSAVGFYRSMGFALTREVNEELHALEPEDVHMIREL